MTVTELHDNPAFEADSETGKSQASTKSRSQASERFVTRWILKDVCCVSFGFFLLFTSYQSMSNLQSSINKTYGTISQSMIYAALILSSAFIPTWMMKKLGERATISVSMLGYSLYIAAQFYPTPYTLIPSAAVLGLAAAPLWSAKCTYLTLAAQQYAKLSGDVTEVVVSKFFGIFFMVFQTSQVVGNLISSIVLVGDYGHVSPDDPALASCGAAFCQVSQGNTSLIKSISDSQRYTMSGIYLGFTLASSAFILMFVNPLSRYCDGTLMRSSTGRSVLQQLGATFHHLRHPYQLLIIPLTFWSGLEQAFLSADFTARWYDEEHIGLIRRWRPVEERNQETTVQDEGDRKDRHSPYPLDNWGPGQRTQCVAQAETDHRVAYHVDAQPARHVSLWI
ncbi:Ion channel regulatory protein UNC-93 [Trinorchestia longiramus]|nr:Ion channel regulatory protein UNC-93 [Trinorchestia longiramus]